MVKLQHLPCFISAAFDTINRTIPADRLSLSYGVSGVALSWFKSYLSRRLQTVKIGECCSSPPNISCSVPLGSGLGTLLFTLYTTPLSSAVSDHHLSHHLHADNIQIYISLSSPFSLQQLRNCLDDIFHWMHESRLKLNAYKTELSVAKNTIATSRIVASNVSALPCWPISYHL